MESPRPPSPQRRNKTPEVEEEERAFRSIFARIVSTLDVPFGYTLSTWASGQLAAERFGPPSFYDILLFVGGAVTAYFLMAVVSSARLWGGSTVRTGEVPLFNVMALITAIAAAALSRLVTPAHLGFLLMGFSSTFLYALLLSFLTYLRWRFGPGPKP